MVGYAGTAAEMLLIQLQPRRIQEESHSCGVLKCQNCRGQLCSADSAVGSWLTWPNIHLLSCCLGLNWVSELLLSPRTNTLYVLS